MNLSDFKTNIFTLFDRRWAALAAGTPDRFNAMTISWGSMGTIWGPPNGGLPIVTVYINPLRYTYEVLNQSDRFTVSFFPEEKRKDLLLLGSRSGRNSGPLKGADLTPAQDDGFVTFEEAEYTFECRKLFQRTMDKEQIPPEIADMFYEPKEEAHRIYIGQVLKILSPKDRAL